LQVVVADHCASFEALFFGKRRINGCWVLNYHFSSCNIEGSVTPQQIAGLFVRLFAVWLALTGVRYFGYDFAGFYQTATDQRVSNSLMFTAYAIFAACIVVSLFLWFFPMFVAHKLIPRTQFNNVLRIETQEVAGVACVVLGLYIFAVWAIPSLLHTIFVAIYIKSQSQPLASLGHDYYYSIFQGVLELGVAIVLTFKARQIAAFFLLPRVKAKEE
jgi:hypothetical protein